MATETKTDTADTTTDTDARTTKRDWEPEDNTADFILYVDGEEVYRTEDEVESFSLLSPQGEKALVRKGDMVEFHIVTQRRTAGSTRHHSHVINAVRALDAVRREGNLAGPQTVVSTPDEPLVRNTTRPAFVGTVTGQENDTVRAMTEREKSESGAESNITDSTASSKSDTKSDTKTDTKTDKK